MVEQPPTEHSWAMIWRFRLIVGPEDRMQRLSRAPGGTGRALVQPRYGHLRKDTSQVDTEQRTVDAVGAETMVERNVAVLRHLAVVDGRAVPTGGLGGLCHGLLPEVDLEVETLKAKGETLGISSFSRILGQFAGARTVRRIWSGTT